MPVAIAHCSFVNNTPAQPADTVTLQGGGLCIQGPSQDSSDNPMSQHGFLQQLSIQLTNTTVAGNVAAEGGGLWTAWPMIIEGCAFVNNTALVSVRFHTCHGDVAGRRQAGSHSGRCVAWACMCCVLRTLCVLCCNCWQATSTLSFYRASSCCCCCLLLSHSHTRCQPPT